MIILFDKDIDSNITSILSNDVECTRFYWNDTTSNWGVDLTGFHITMGADATVITFNSAEALQPYIDQFLSIDEGISPINDFVPNPDYVRGDKSSNGQIVPHTYVDTDIEKDLIEGSN